METIKTVIQSRYRYQRSSRSKVIPLQQDSREQRQVLRRWCKLPAVRHERRSAGGDEFAVWSTESDIYRRISGRWDADGYAAPPKKSKAGIIFAVAAVVAVVLVGVLAWRVFRVPLAGTDPQKLYEQGMDIMAKEMETYNSSISEDIGFDEITAFQRENPMQFQADMTFVLPESYDYENIDFDINMDLVTDWKNKKASAELGVGAYGMTLPIGELVTDGASNSIFFQCPIVSEEVYSVELTDFGKKFNESAWARFLESELPEDYTMELFSENMEAAETEQSQAELSDIFAKFTDALQSARELTAVREKRRFGSVIKK